VKKEDVLAVLARRNAVIANDHVVYASGRHGSQYVNKDGVYPYIDDVKGICEGMAEPFVGKGIEVVAAPAVAGTVLAHRVACFLSRVEGREILAVYADKIDVYGCFQDQADGQWKPRKIEEKYEFRRGYDKLLRGKRTLVVEDVLTTGGSVAKVVTAGRACGAVIDHVSAMCNRGRVTADKIGVPNLFSLVEIDMDSYPEEECPLCAKDFPINMAVGKGKDFLTRKRRAE